MGGRLVLTTWGSFGDVNPYLAIGRELMARGHAPVLATLPAYRDYIESTGVGFHPVGPEVDPDDRLLIREIMNPKTGTERLLRKLLFPAVRRSYEELSEAVAGADLLVTHPVTYAGPLVAEKNGLPWISTALAPISFFSASDLPVFAPLPQLVHLGKLGPGMSRRLIQFGRYITRNWSAPVRLLRAELGLPPAGDPIYEGQFSPSMNLALFSRVMAAPQPDWPSHTKVTGFSFYDDGIGGRCLSPELQEFFEAGSPPVVFTLGTSAVMAAGDFYAESLKAAQSLRRRAVLVIGKDPNNRPPGPLPDTVITCEFAPFGELFSRAAAIVHSGGVGTTGQALRAGRPMLVVPFAHDQPDNAYRVTRLGIARTLYPKRYRAACVARELQKLLEDPIYAARAAEVGRQVRAEDGVRAACDAIEEGLVAPQR